MTENLPQIFTPEAPAEIAPASPFGPPLPAPTTEHEMAELYAAAHFLDGADDRYPETAQVAAEIHNLLGGDPFQRQGDPYSDAPAGPARDANGRFAPTSGKYVPHQAMERERIRRKESEAKLRESELRVAKAEERLGVLSELMNAAQQGQQPQQQHDQRQQQQSGVDGFVDPEVDVFAAVQQLQKQNAQLKAEQSEKQFIEAYRVDATRFAQANPSHFDAHAYLVASRDRELELMGLTDPAQRRRQIALEERELVRQNLHAGNSPSAALYNLAKLRGFTGGGRPAQPRPTPAYDQKSVSQIEGIQRGQQANVSLSGTGGSGRGGLTVQQIADMPEDEFHKLIQKMGGLGSPAVQRAFGGQ